ncbi:hypothetical protein NA57DRAFT_64528 [Rhizodiscina lignyota]|uniref:FAD-binding FR-type domain-containing protein n=1 Tax=Rhizodiscina lignyota TaxID=1504668 RepID=A0A9P4IM81_9PEZI|nr:hypothetical protein NA57DRAFT_64528 [Rhizodiscina lignyota]
MAFGYAFLDLTKEDKLDRRHLLDLYASIAQISAVAILVLLQLRFIASWALTRFAVAPDSEMPSSPYLKAEKQNRHSLSFLRRFSLFSRQVQWWMGEEVIRGWGTRGEWVGGALWTLWLLFLCVNQTGQDYFALTKRFGIVGVSQLPMHYLLATKTPYSPLQILTRSSHEQLQAIHQVLGRVITFFFVLHAIFYLNSFFQKGILLDRLQNSRVVIIGLTSISLFIILGSTALAWIRRWSYRVFYASHIIIALAVLPLLYFHVHQTHIFIWETLVVYVLHMIARFISLRTYDGTISMVADTNLIRVEIPLRKSVSDGAWWPGSHVYLRIPRHQSMASTAVTRLKETIGLRTNPFTVASVPQLDRKVVLVARAMKGNTKELADLAHSLSMGSGEAASLRLKIDGPYGASSWLPDFTEFDSILLVAGGVGATFIVPLWRSICMTRGKDGRSHADKVRFVWAVQKLADTKWFFPSAEANTVLPHVGHGAASSHVTNRADDDAGENIELEEREHLMGSSGDAPAETPGLIVKYGRPRLDAIVSDCFAVPGSRVAVLVCGPQSMSTELRQDVGKWVKKGRDAFWHAEAFGL